MLGPISKGGFKFSLGGIVTFLGSPQFANAAESANWAYDLQESVTPVMSRITELHDFINIIITAIAIFVLALLVYVVLRFRRSVNPEPSTNSHNTVLEVAWTVIPIVILAVIAVPSFKLLYFMDRTTDAEMTLKISGHQWYWSYQYPDHGGFEFDSFMVAKEDLEPGEPRLLAVDEPVVLPIDTNVRLLFASTDVIHSWTIPAFGVKNDTVPGRLNESWVRIEKEGTYYGQCSELCGVNHGFMPIEVQAVSKEAFKEWATRAQENFARGEPPPDVEPIRLVDSLATETTHD